MARIIMLFFAILSGTVTSQLPEFAQQYRQRIGGAVDALQQVMADFEADASAFGLTVDEAIARLKSGADGFARERGESMAEAKDRLDRLNTQQSELRSSGPFTRLAVFLQNMDPQLTEATAKDYEPALPVTTEGAVAAGLGGLAGLLVASILLGLGRLRRRRPAT